MAASETAEFKLVVDAGMASKTLEDVRARALGLGGGLDRLNDGLDKIGGKSGADAEKAVRSLSFALGGAGGKGAEFLSVVGDLSGILSGGALGLALAGVGVVASKVGEAFEEAEAGARGFDEAVAAMNASLRTSTEQELAAMRQGVVDLRTELENFGRDSRQIRIESLQAKLAGAEGPQAAVQAELDQARARLQRAQEFADTLRGERFQDDAQVARNLVSALEARLASLQTRAAEARADLDEATDLALRLDARETEKKNEDDEKREAEQRRRGQRAALEGALGDVSDHLNEILDEREAARAKTEALRDKEIEDAKKYAEDLARLDREAKDLVQRQQEEHDAKMQVLRDRELADRQAVAAQAIGIGVGVTQQLIDDAIKGQDQMLERFAASIFRQAGTAVIGHGINAAAGGIAKLSLGDVPGGTAALGTGAALIGTGLALGGIASGFEASLAGGGSSSAAREPGVTASAPAASSGGGAAPVTVVFQYGIGPTPEKMARDLAQATNYARDHRILSDGARRR